MDSFGGFEPQVGVIIALRTFRVGPGGVLFPLFSARPWVDGENTARCRVMSGAAADPQLHPVPEPDCTCGFYAYATETAAGEYPHARHVLAAVACWGRVVAGTRGLRAQHARIEALWIGDTVPADLATMVAARYPSATTYAGRAEMLAAHPPSVLDCYEPADGSSRRSTARLLRVAVFCGLVLGLVPWHVLRANSELLTVWAGLLTFFLVGTVVRGRRRTDPAAQRRKMLFFALTLWLLASSAGPAGTLVLRLPLLQLAVLTGLHRRALNRVAARFPAVID